MTDGSGMNGEGRIENGSVKWMSSAPKVSDALKRGTFVTASTWSDEVTGLVCDWGESGLLLDEADESGYLFVPWASIHHVRIEEVEQRRVKSLP